MPSPDYYKRKCERLSAQLATLQAAQPLPAPRETRAILIDVQRNGRTIKFTFMRNGVLTHIETYGTWGQSLEGLIDG